MKHKTKRQQVIYWLLVVFIGLVSGIAFGLWGLLVASVAVLALVYVAVGEYYS